MGTMSVKSRPRGHPAFKILLAVIWLQPVLLVGSVLLAALAANMEIGHWPKPSIDDPSGMGAPVQFFSVAWGFFLFGTLYTAILGIIGTPIYFVHFRSTRLAAWATSIYGAALLLSFWFVFIDPTGFIDWLMD
jgi:hypothetical protein